MIHFIKRELETLLCARYYTLNVWPTVLLNLLSSVHRFSHSTMPIFNIFKKYVTFENVFLTAYVSSSLHYHIFSGLLLALDVYRPKYSATSPYIVNTPRDNESVLWIGAGVWAVSPPLALHQSTPYSVHSLVLPAFQLSHPSHAAITSTSG